MIISGRSKNIDFTGHSLGGAIAQIQSVYFANKMRGTTKTFEAFGLKSQVHLTLEVIHDNKVYYPTLNPIKSLRSWASTFGILFDGGDWEDLEDKLIGKYAGDKVNIDSKITNYIREGDLVGTTAELVGSTNVIKTGLSSLSVTLLHSMSNYRYQGYLPDGTLIDTQINTTNASILSEKLSPAYQEIINTQKAKYKACFSKMSNYIEV
ncbi:hypothetical protein LO80_01905 [Candidatus Francisella endociliophora]|uniref:Fungal lipase-type domain-containing protein n=2 Tax=Candidatus Francisella endociliophora TaxID=653937 RepID=A0A097EMS3_9GAMM|nr:hypothetical protein LO80_01905 [Francisella sp. FSC1006]